MDRAPYLGRPDYDKGSWWESKTEKVTETYQWMKSKWQGTGWDKPPMPDSGNATHWRATASSDPDPSQSWRFGGATERHPTPKGRPISLTPNDDRVEHREYKKVSRSTSERSHHRGRASMDARSSRSRSAARKRPHKDHWHRSERRLYRSLREHLRDSLDPWALLQPNPKYSTDEHDMRECRYVPENGDPLASHMWTSYCPPPLVGNKPGGRWKMPWAEPYKDAICSYHGCDRDCRKGVLCARWHSRKKHAKPFHANKEGEYVEGDYRAREGTNLREEDMFDNETIARSNFWTLGWRYDPNVPGNWAPRFFDMLCQELLPMPNDPNFGWYWKEDPKTMVPVINKEGSTKYAAECRAPLPTVRGRAYPVVVEPDEPAPHQEYFPPFPPGMNGDGDGPTPPTGDQWEDHVNAQEEVITPTEVPVEPPTDTRVPSTPLTAPTVGHYSAADDSSTDEATQHASTDLPTPGSLIHENQLPTTDRVVLVDHISKCPHGTSPADAKALMTPVAWNAMMADLQTTNPVIARSRSQSRDRFRIRPAGNRPTTPRRGRKGQGQSPAAARNPFDPALLAREAAERNKAHAPQVVGRGGSPARVRPQVSTRHPVSHAPMPAPAAPTTAHSPLQPASPPTDSSTRPGIPEHHWLESAEVSIYEKFLSLDTLGQRTILDLFPLAEQNYGTLSPETLDRLTRQLAVAKEACVARVAAEEANNKTVAARREALEAKCAAPTDKPIPSFLALGTRTKKMKSKAKMEVNTVPQAKMEVKTEVKVEEVASSDDENPGKKPKMTAIRTPLPGPFPNPYRAPVSTEPIASTVDTAEVVNSPPPGLSLSTTEPHPIAGVVCVPQVASSTAPSELETSMPTAAENTTPSLALPVAVVPDEQVVQLTDGSTCPMDLPNDDDVPSPSRTETPYDNSSDQYSEAEQAQPGQSAMPGPPPTPTNSPIPEEEQIITPHADGLDTASSSSSSSESSRYSGTSESTSVSAVPGRVPSNGSNGPAADGLWASGTGPFAPRSSDDAASAAAGGILTIDSMSSPAARHATLHTDFVLENGLDPTLVESAVVGDVTVVTQARTEEVASTLPIPHGSSSSQSPPVDESDADWGVSEEVASEAVAAYAAEKGKEK